MVAQKWHRKIGSCVFVARPSAKVYLLDGQKKNRQIRKEGVGKYGILMDAATIGRDAGVDVVVVQLPWKDGRGVEYTEVFVESWQLDPAPMRKCAPVKKALQEW